MVELATQGILCSLDGAASASPLATEEGAGAVILRFQLSQEALHQLDQLAAATGSSLEEVIGKALILFKIAAEAHLDGKEIAILDRDGNVEQDIIGFEGAQRRHATRPA